MKIEREKINNFSIQNNDIIYILYAHYIHWYFKTKHTQSLVVCVHINITHQMLLNSFTLLVCLYCYFLLLFSSICPICAIGKQTNKPNWYTIPLSLPDDDDDDDDVDNQTPNTFPLCYFLLLLFLFFSLSLSLYRLLFRINCL